MLTNEQKATLYCEKYGIIPHKVTRQRLIYYANYPAYLNEKRRTYKVVVRLSDMTETRQELRRYSKLGECNRYK